MNFSPKQVFLTVVGIVGFLFLFQIMRIVALVKDSQAILKTMSGDSAVFLGGTKPGDPPPKYLLPIMEGLTLPETFSESLDPYSNNPWDTTSRGKTTIADCRDILKKIPHWQDVPGKIEGRVTTTLASLPRIVPNQEYIRSSAPIPNYRKIRETARFWSLLGRTLAEEGKGGQALRVFLGILLIAQWSEAMEARTNGLLLLGRMIAVACRNIAAAGFTTNAQFFHLDQTDAGLFLDIMKKLEEKMASFSQALDSERKILPSLGYFGMEAVKDGTALKIFGRNPTRLLSALNNKPFLDEYLDPVYKPAFEACSMPYPKAREFMKDAYVKLEKIFERPMTPGPHFFGYFFQPQTYVLDLLIAICAPNLKKALEQDVACLTKLRGSSICVALHAYHDANSGWPNSLGDLEKWVGRTFSKDPLGDQPFGYERGSPPRLFSVGPDGKPGNADDLVFLPVPER